MTDKRKPKLKKVGCAYWCHDNNGFHFFEKDFEVDDGQVFIYNEGILWVLE